MIMLRNSICYHYDRRLVDKRISVLISTLFGHVYLIMTLNRDCCSRYEGDNLLGGSGGAKPHEKKLGILPHQNEFFHQSRLRDTLSEKYSPYLGGVYLTQIIKFENVPYLGGVYLAGGFYLATQCSPSL